MRHISHRLSLACLASLVTLLGWAEAPAGYYDAAVGKSGEALQSSLYEIISDAGTISYSGLWTAYKTTDKRADGKVWDMYSDVTNYTFGTDQCGNYSGEGSCYNREHSVPKSWFNDASPMYSDIWHVYPTDGQINGYRGNYPFGEVGSGASSSKNGFSKWGSCVTPGYSGTVFEPNDEYKGDFARSYFYFATRYKTKITGWGGIFTSSYPHIVKWQLDMLLRWHESDPVSEKELERNEAVYDTQQGNRNPYIDYPELVDLVFGDRRTEVFNPNGADVGFVALPAKEITSTSFVAAWTPQASATDYELNVWYNQYSMATVTGEIINVSFTEKPDTWSYSGYTKVENGYLRLASGSQDGTATSPALDLSGGVLITVEAAPYKDDKAILYILVDDEEISQVELNGTETKMIPVTAGGASSKITLKANAGKRLYLHNVKVTYEGEKVTTILAGYPRKVGDVTQYAVTDLTPGRQYYYTVTPYVGTEAQAVSNTIQVKTATSIDEVEKDHILIYTSGTTLHVINAPTNAVASWYTIDGRLCGSRLLYAEENEWELPEGIYIVRVVSPAIQSVQRIYSVCQ